MGLKVERFGFFYRTTRKKSYEEELEERLNQIEREGHTVVCLTVRPGDADNLIIYREKETKVVRRQSR